MKYVTLTTAIAIAAVAGYFSIIGLSTIFAGAFWAVVIMATVLEIGKLVTAAYLHLEWEKISTWIRTYLISAVFVLMIITSMGIFGYLSKAHLEQTINQGGNNDLRIENLERQIDRQQAIITDSETVLSQLDEAVATLIEYDRIRGPSGSIATRESQKEERQNLNDTINTAYERIDRLQSELIPLNQQKISLEAEIGPIKYIAELIYGENYDIDNAVRFVILLLVFVFDPLAIILLIVSTAQFRDDKMEKVARGLVNDKQIMVMQ